MYMSSATIETVYMYTIWVTMHAMQKFQMLGSYMEDLTKPRHNFIGYDFKYGSDFVRNYSCANFSVVNLIRD